MCMRKETAAFDLSCTGETLLEEVHGELYCEINVKYVVKQAL